MLVTCFSNGRRADVQALGDPAVGQPFDHQRQHVALAGGEAFERAGAAPAAHHPRDHLGVQRRPARGHLAHRAEEVVEVGDAILEQVADALRVVAEQLQRVALGQVLGEHEHAGARHRTADRDRRAQAVVGQVRRHPDVGDDDVGPVRAGLADQVRGIAG